MSILTSASFYTARLRVTPSPATLSETFAILSELKQFGTIATFVQDVTTQQSASSDPDQANANGKPYSIVYTTLAPRLQTIRVESAKDHSKSSLNFNVSANAVYPNPRDLDPYNVRGLLQRKPRPEAVTFACTLTLEQETKPHPGADILGYTEHSGPFSVDRDDGYAWVLAKSNTPAGLIAGLLPRTNKTVKASNAEGKEEPAQTTTTELNPAQKEYMISENTPLATFSLSDLYKQTLKKEAKDPAKNFVQYKKLRTKHKLL